MENFLIAEHTTPLYLTNPSFSGHQTFPFRYTWLKKGVDAVRKDATIFSSKDASVTLGVGKNMVDSIRYWCRVSNLIKIEKNQLYINLREREAPVSPSNSFSLNLATPFLATKTTKDLIRILRIPPHCG